MTITLLSVDSSAIELVDLENTGVAIGSLLVLQLRVEVSIAI
jgi:hypothetical protein